MPLSLEEELLELLKKQNTASDKRWDALMALTADGNKKLDRLVEIHEEKREEEKADRQAALDLEKAKAEGRTVLMRGLVTKQGLALVTTVVTAITGGFAVFWDTVSKWFGWHGNHTP